MARWVIGEDPEYLVAELLVKGPGLETVRVEMGGNTTALDGIGFDRLQQPAAVTEMTFASGDPQELDVQPAAPDRADHAADPFAAAVPQKEIGRISFGNPGRRDVMQINPLLDEIEQRGARQRLEDQIAIGHPTLPPPRPGSSGPRPSRDRP